MAVWDTRRQELSLIRDPFGIKPLFIYHRNGLLSFGSELKALLAGAEFDRALNLQALTEYLQYLYVPAPQSIFRHVAKLCPATFLQLLILRPSPALTPFWSV